MGTPDEAEILMVSIEYNSGSLGVAVGFSARRIPEDVIIRGEGVTGPSARGIVRDTVEVDVDWLSDAAAAVAADPASLVIVVDKVDGTSKTYTFADMTPRGAAFEFQRDNPPGTKRQTFVFQGDDASTCCSDMP